METVYAIKFRVKRIVYRNPETKHTIVNAVLLEKPKGVRKITKEMIIQGFFPTVFESDEFQANVVYQVHKNYGPQLEIQSFPDYLIPENEHALAKFLAFRVKGLGIKTATRIVNDLGVDTIQRLTSDHSLDFSKWKISKKKAESIRKSLENILGFERLAILIQEQGLPLYLAVNLYREFEDHALHLVQTNPYFLSIKGFISFSVADKLARRAGLPFDDQNRIEGAIHAYMRYRIYSLGDVCIYQSVLISDLNEFLKWNGSYEEIVKRNQIKQILKELIQQKQIKTERDSYLNTYLYTPEMYEVEDIIVTKIFSLISDYRPPFCKETDVQVFLDDWERTYGELDGLQIQAVYNALLNNISILTGNPGTGKTFTTNLIVKAILSIRKNAKISLLAPTGKASERVTELTGLAASTIHRGLHINTFELGGAYDKVDADFIIVDESSMIDAPLFAKLMRRVDDHSRLIFVGDIEQLPPVGPGLILKDLIETGAIKTIRLTTIFRQAKDSEIVMNAHAMIAGLNSKNSKGFQLHTDPDSDFQFIQEDNTLKIQEIVEQLIRDQMKEGYTLDDICLLTPMKKGDLGTLEFNERFQQQFNPNVNDPTAISYNLFGTVHFYEGDRVIQTHNNYDLNVFNGFVGEIREIFEGVNGRGQAEMQMRVYFPNQDKTVTYPEKFIHELDLCYAMTIHKSQGSEFPVVILPVHMSQKTMLNRNLLYTGLTRGKQKVYMVGQADAIDYGIDYVEHFQRTSRIQSKILKKTEKMKEDEEHSV